MKHNHIIQRIADVCAKENGYLCALYLGKIGEETFVYKPMEADSELRCEGLCKWIVVRDGKAEFLSLLTYKPFEGLKKRDFKKGREMYKCYRDVWFGHTPSTNEEQQYAATIVHLVEGLGYDGGNVEPTTMYQYLEIAERLNMKITSVPVSSTMDRCDGWKYYIQLVEK